MTDDRDNVRSLPTAGALPENPIEIEQQPFSCCRHESILIDSHLRTIECKKCGASLDAFDYLLNDATNIQRAWQYHREVMARVDRLNESVTKLVREEKRLKASVRRLQEKAATAVTTRAPV